MGTASSLFFSADTKAETLHRRITPTDDQFGVQQERWNALAEHLKADLREKAGCAVDTWLQGSYKFGTQVRPARKGDEFDIDLGFYFVWTGLPQGGLHSNEELRDFVQASLEAYGRETDDVLRVAPSKPRCCRIHYKEDFHVDVPCYHLDRGRDARTLATRDGWEGSDPKALYKWFKDEFDEDDRARVRRQVRYLKSWAGLRFRANEGRPSSVVLTTLVAEAYLGLDADERLSPDDELLGLLLSAIRLRLGRSMSVWNPVDRTEDMNRLSPEHARAFKDGIDRFCDAAGVALAAEEEVTAADAWSGVFGHFFPMPDMESASLNEGTDTLVKSNALTTVAPLPTVLVTAIPDGNRHLVLKGRDRIGPIPRGCSIQFEVENSDALPVGTTVEWMARNGGQEAELRNDMGHAGQPGYIWDDRSAYVGTHHMDVVFRRFGRLTGIKRVPVLVNGVPVPPRSPPKPAWVRLRGRR